MPLTIIIPTYNEEKNILRALESCSKYVDQIIIADSSSTDNTIQLAKDYSDNIEIINIKNYVSFSDKMNQALISQLIRNNWIMRLDADEIIIDPIQFFNTLSSLIDDNIQNIIGFFIIRRYYFLKHWVKYGDMYPRYAMRIWKKDMAFFDSRLVDEKMLFKGKAVMLPIEIADINQSGFAKWFSKHIICAKNEALQTSNTDEENAPTAQIDLKTQENKIKYYKFPIFIRPFLYFLYRFLLKKGFKDDVTGIFYHFIHAFLYREIVDFFILKNKLFKFRSKYPYNDT